MQNTLPWAEEARCRGLSTAEFDPWHPETDRAVMFATARRVCMSCPVRLQCALYGLSLLELAGNQGGMFGGLEPAGLMKLARDLELPVRIRAQHGSRSGYVAGCGCGPCRASNASYETARRHPPGSVRRCASPTVTGMACGGYAMAGSDLCNAHRAAVPVELAV